MDPEVEIGMQLSPTTAVLGSLAIQLFNLFEPKILLLIDPNCQLEFSIFEMIPH